MKGWMLPLVIAAAAFAPPRALGSEAWPVMAYQPFNLPNGIALSPMSYIGYYSPLGAVTMTCWANRVWHPEQGKAYQENAAFAAGLRVSLEFGDSMTPDSTLSAELHVPTAFHLENGWDDPTLIEAIVECMKATLGQFAPAVRFLAIKIKGPRRYARYGGTFDVRDYKCGPKVWQFP
jgi:hypothetical protein